MENEKLKELSECFMQYFEKIKNIIKQFLDTVIPIINECTIALNSASVKEKYYALHAKKKRVRKKYWNRILENT